VKLIFLPQNELDISNNEVYRKKRQTEENDESPQIKEIVYAHMYDGFMFSGDMEDEQVSNDSI